MMRSAALLILSAQLAAAASIPSSEYQARRARLAKEIGPDAMLVVFSGKPKARDMDIEYPFRQGDTMLYLTGMDQPDATLVMLPGETELREVLFVRDSNPRQEMWTGHIVTHDEVTAGSGISKVESAARFRPFINAALGGGVWDPLFYPRAMPSFYNTVRTGNAEIWLLIGTEEQNAQQAFVDELRNTHPDVHFRNATPILIGMRENKSSN